MNKYSGADPNAMLYKYYQKHEVATLSLGINYNVNSDSAILAPGGPTLIHQLYFNLVQEILDNFKFLGFLYRTDIHIYICVYNL